MKNIFLVLFTMIFFAGCSFNNLSKNEVESKSQLIEKANDGDIKAMLDLNEYYSFPQTQEGLYYFNKWYTSIDKKDNKEDIYNIGKVYFEYKNMFINGEQKANKLFLIASELGYTRAYIEQIDTYLYLYDFDEALKLEKQLLPKLNEKQLQELFLVYKNRYYSKGQKRISQYLQEKGYKAPIEARLKEIKALMYKKKDKSNFNDKINAIVDSKDKEEIQRLADFLYKRYKYTKALYVYKELIKLDEKNDKAYLNMAYINLKGSYREKLEKDKSKAIEYFKKAYELNNKDAAYDLLLTYANDKKYLDAFFEHKTSLEKSDEGKLILAKYYRKKRQKEKSTNILTVLAKEGNKDAILTLALRKPNKYDFDPDEYKQTLKWQEYIVESKDELLIEDFKKELFKYTYKKDFAVMVQYLRKQDVENKNILTLRAMYKDNKYKNKEEALTYLEKAASYGDVFSKTELAKVYTKQKNFEKTIVALEDLSNLGQLDATYRLANLYMKPPYYFKDKKDVKKGLSYYEVLANNGNLKAMRKLADNYLCGTCFDGEAVNYKKAMVYLKKLDEKGYPRYTASIGWLYNFGKGVKTDLQKAKEYYEKAAKLGYGNAYYYLAWLYYEDKDHPKESELIKLDYKKALEYLQKGEKVNNSNCINLLGVFYLKGYAVEQNKETAVRYFKKVARSNKYSSFHLGKYYFDKKDYKNSFKHFNRSAKLGSPAAMVEVGIIYEQGLLGEVDIKKAIRAYEEAFKKDEKIAAYNLGLIYHYGKGGLEKNSFKAIKWYRKAQSEKANKQIKLLK